MCDNDEIEFRFAGNDVTRCEQCNHLMMGTDDSCRQCQQRTELEQMPRDARIRKLEERNENYRHAIEEAIEQLEAAHSPNGEYDDDAVDSVVSWLRTVVP